MEAFNKTSDSAGGQTEIPSQMRAVVLDGVGFEHLRVTRVPVPVPGPNQLLARVDAAGV